MYRQFSLLSSFLRTGIRKMFDGPQMLAVLPAFVLAGYWIGGEILLTLTAIGFPAAVALWSLIQPLRQGRNDDAMHHRASDRSSFGTHMEKALKNARGLSWNTACLVLRPDDFDVLTDRYGSAVAQELIEKIRQRLDTAIRGRDCVSRISTDRLGVVVAPVEHLNLDILLQLASRLQSAAEEPLQAGGSTIYISVSVGFAMDTAFREDSGKKMAEAADLALKFARRKGPSSIRAYTPDMGDRRLNSHVASADVELALDNGQIRPWFQPQISTDTGKVTGFEALARWEHPERGIVPPAEFLPKIQKAGKMERLGEVILAGALEALKTWDSLGMNIPQVGVNFSPEELGSPRLIQKIEWELDRFGLTADRLAIEILETVVATSPDDMIARNISGLSELGCQIDLDDFGTGHASISSLRRFNIQRLKIDRSFVLKVDQDPEQQRMVSAILLMAERLDLATLAEGIETAGEHAMLAQLGCGDVQGFGIGKPMPFSETQAWVANHLAKLSAPPAIGFKAG